MKNLLRANTLKVFIFTCLFSAQLFTLSTVHAKSGGGAIAGGGGDASEERVNEIRSDILSWLNKGGAKNLELSEITYSEYLSKMNEILQPQRVVVGFVENDDSDNEELKVSVDGIPKTCRGFISKIDLKEHILCNISRFKNSSEPEQYRLIHHEYAGLVNVENNDGAASDYTISAQLTDYLRKQTVLKLAITRQIKTTENIKPEIIISKSKYIGNDSFEVTLSVINTQDVNQVILEDGATGKNDFNSCQSSMPDLAFHEGEFEKTITLTSIECVKSYRYIFFGTVSVEYKDGTIKPLNFLKIPYVTHNYDQNHIVEMDTEIVSELIDTFIPIDFSKPIKRKSLKIEFSYKVTEADMANYKGVIFSNGEEFLTNEPSKLSEMINSKRIIETLVYEEEHATVFNCYTYWFCLGSKAIIKKDKFKLMNFSISHITLIKKSEFIEFETTIVESI